MKQKNALILLLGALCCPSTVIPAQAAVPGTARLATMTPARSELMVAVVDSSEKVRPAARFAADPAPKIRLAAVRNEEESGQFVLYSERGQGALTFSLTDLRTTNGKTIPASALTLLKTHLVRVARPSDTHGAAGEWPDALVPITASVNLEPGRSQGFWLVARVGADVAPGTYQGSVLVRSGGATLAAVAIELEVWKAVLSATPTLPTLVGLDFEMISRFEGVPPSSPAFEADVLPPYYRALRRNHAYPLFIHGARPGYRDDGQRVILDMAPFWRRVDAALGEAKSSAPIGIPFSESWPVDSAAYPIMSPEYMHRVRRYLTALSAELEAKGALSRSFIYLATTDEPTSAEQIARIRKFADLIRQADPRLRLLQTVHASCEDCPQGGQVQLEHPSLLWAPNIAYFDTKAMGPARFLGFGRASRPSGWTAAISARLTSERRQVWWYLNPWTFLLDPAPAYPTLFVDHPGIEHRAAGWLAFRHGIAGLGHWNATYWRNVNNPWSELPHGEGGNGTAGDGVLLYPARGSTAYTGQPSTGAPISTVRLELMREGAEDHALLTQLRLTKGESLAESVMAELLRSLSDFERDPAKYRHARRRIAQALS